MAQLLFTPLYRLNLKKKEVKIFLVSVLVLTCVILSQILLNIHYTYNIPDSEDGIKNGILEKYNSNPELNKVSFEDINIEDIITVENYKIILFSIYSAKIDYKFTGLLLAKKGINQKYSLEYFSHGTKLYNGQVVSINKSKYLTIYGTNYKRAIDTIVAVTDNQRYEINLTGKDIFLECYVLDQLSEDTNYIPIEWKIYDESNRDITDQINKEYRENILRQVRQGNISPGLSRNDKSKSGNHALLL